MVLKINNHLKTGGTVGRYKRLKLIVVSLLFIFIGIVGFSVTAEATGTCTVSLSSRSIDKNSCSAVGSVTFRFESGTVFNGGDWWYMDLPAEVKICRTVDYLILGNTNAGAVDISGGPTKTLFSIASGIPTMPAGTEAGPMVIEEMSAGAQGITVNGGNAAIRVTARAGTQKVFVQIYASNDTTSLTVGAGTSFFLKLLDGGRYRNFIFQDTDDGAGGAPDEIYGNAKNQADLLGGSLSDLRPEPVAENTLCVNARDLTDNILWVSYASLHDFVTFMGNKQIAHVVDGSPQDETCTCDYVTMNQITVNPFNRLKAGDEITFTVTAVSDCPGSVYYKFFYQKINSGQNEPEAPWHVIQDYSNLNQCSYTFSQNGAYIVVVRAACNPDNEPDTVAIIGKTLTIGDAPQSIYFQEMKLTAPDIIETGQTVTLMATAATNDASAVYYRFDLVPDYGDAAYDPVNMWEMIQEFSTQNAAQIMFQNPGHYILIVKASNTPDLISGTVSIAGLSVYVK